MPEKIIQQAEIQIRQGYPDKAEKLLLQVRKEYPAYTNQVMTLLANLKPVSSQRKSRQIVKLENTWVGIKEHGINHPQMMKFLPDLFDMDLKEEIALIRLRDEVINKICEGMNNIDDEIWLEELIKPIQKHPNFEHYLNLEQELEKWWVARFTQQYDQIVIIVDQMLKNWNVEKALQSVSPLLKPTLPCRLRDKVTQLQQNIGQVKNDKQHLKTQLNELKTHVTDWTVLQTLMTCSQTVQCFQYIIPQNWQTKIDNALEAFSMSTQNFTTKQVQACHNLQELRDFYRKFQRLGLKALPLDCFKQIQKTYQEKNDNALKNAISIKQLLDIHQGILDEKTALPAILSTWLQQRADTVFNIIQKWQQMINGVELINPIENIPTAFQHEILQYQKLWENLQEIEKQIKTESNFQEILITLEHILQKHPNHQFAQNLHQKTETKRQRYRFDKALEQWDIKGFFELCQQSPLQYVQLMQNEKSIHRLKELYQAEQFINTQEATTWWENWHQTISQCPKLPYPFLEQLEIITLERRQQWFKILNDIQQEKLSSEIYHQIADSVKKWQQNFHFVRYYRDFKRLAWEQEAIEYLAIKKWTNVQQAITQFEDVGGDKNTLEQLKVLLAVEQAADESLEDLVDILKEQWFLIKHHLSHKIDQLLYQTIQYTWKNKDEKRCNSLKTLAKTIECSPQLNFWIQWLDIEASLITADNLVIFSKLVFINKGYGIRETLREPLKRIIAQWKSDNDILYIWFYNAAQRINPPLIHSADDPLGQMMRQSQHIAINIKDTLTQLSNISDTNLADSQITIKTEHKKWQNLLEYTNLLPFPVAQPPIIPDNLVQIIDLIEQLKKIKKALQDLEEADLRQTRHQSTLNTVQMILRNKFSDFSIYETWSKRAEDLEPLTCLFFINEQFNKITRDFGRNDPEILRKSDLFEIMRAYLLDLVEKFKQAKVVGRGMWRTVSKDCWTLVCENTTEISMPNTPDLQDLCDLLPILAQEEEQFRLFLINIYNEAQLTYLPPGAKIDVNKEQYQAFFSTFPKKTPRTHRCYYLFEREACKEPMATLLKQETAWALLPKWVNNFLDKGIPKC